MDKKYDASVDVMYKRGRIESHSLLAIGPDPDTARDNLYERIRSRDTDINPDKCESYYVWEIDKSDELVE